VFSLNILLFCVSFKRIERVTDDNITLNDKDRVNRENK